MDRQGVIEIDARLVGGLLLLLVPLVVADGMIEARGRFSSLFWASDRDRKLEHIAGGG